MDDFDDDFMDGFLFGWFIFYDTTTTKSGCLFSVIALILILGLLYCFYSS